MRRRRRSRRHHRSPSRQRMPRHRRRSRSSAPSDAHGVLGRDVLSAANEDMGRIVDVIVDRSGHVRAAVIDFGGFLGVGSRKIVVDWNAMRFGKIVNKKDSITLELTKAAGRGRAGIQGGHADGGARRVRQPAAAASSFSEARGGMAAGAVDRGSRIMRIAKAALSRTTFAAPDRPAGIRRAVAPEPARPRLVHLLPRRRADRIRAVHRGLSDDPEMDPGRDRPRAVDRRHRCA